MDTFSECKMKHIVESLGGLVWVQRRNGTWWPGRIIGLDELSDNSSVSPKSETPLMLLGRDDVSVDWYNLENSKHVKAFRCGEYDQCIERAKALAANFRNNSVRYTQRNDAILRALEIEKSILSKKHKENENSRNNIDHAKESPTVSHSSGKYEGVTEEVKENSNTTQDLSQSGLSFEDPNDMSRKEQCVHLKRRKTPIDSEDDGTEGIKRLRGLLDLSLGIVTERKPQAGGDPDLIQDTTFPSDANTGSHLNGVKGDLLSLREKKSIVVTNAVELFKRKKRRRPLTKILESATWVSVPIMYDELAMKSGLETYAFKRNLEVGVASSGTSCENGLLYNITEIDFGASLVHDIIMEDTILSITDLPQIACTDTLFDVPIILEESHPAGFHSMLSPCSYGKLEADVIRQSNQIYPAETLSLKNEHPVDIGPMRSVAVHNSAQISSRETSKWESNEKQKTKCISTEDDFEDGFHHPHCNDGLKLLLDSSPREFNGKYQPPDFPSSNYCTDTLLYDVDLQVKASYSSGHVSLVSIVSKLDGKAIVGHPLSVGIISCDGDPCYLPCTSSDSGDDSPSNFEPMKSPCLRKTRKLSWLTGNGRFIVPRSSPVREVTMERMERGGVISCVPLKVVFSRLIDAVNYGAATCRRDFEGSF